MTHKQVICHLFTNNKQGYQIQTMDKGPEEMILTCTDSLHTYHLGELSFSRNAHKNYGKGLQQISITQNLRHGTCVVCVEMCQNPSSAYRIGMYI